MKKLSKVQIRPSEPELSQSLLMRLGVQRDRASALLPILRSISGGLYGPGKEALNGASGLAGKEAPESAEQIVDGLTKILAEAHQIADDIHSRL
jgi:hypothetical protein